MNNTIVTVFDCVVFVQAILSKTGPAARCIELVENRSVRLVMSEEILTEIKDTLEELRTTFHDAAITEEKIEHLIEMLIIHAEFVRSVERRFEYPRDPNDEPYLNLAIAAEADFIVSRDDDLLSLMTGHSPEAKEFRQRFRKIKIVDPIEFLDAVTPRDLGVDP